jgi:hypothetical protein
LQFGLISLKLNNPEPNKPNITYELCLTFLLLFDLF